MKKVLYNITYNVDESVIEDWLTWMKSEFIPKLVATEFFESANMVKILVEEEMGGVSYAVMYKSPNLEILENFVVNHSHKFNKELSDKFGQKALTFMTLLEEEFSIKNP
ncbi:MAG: DUF4286 family protein [Flavobacteriales bacterium]|nr:DUF4286 family protein [Flavobacteriales bacterium]